MPSTKNNKKSTLGSGIRGGVFPQMKWGESYTSLFLGIVVVVVAAILVFSFLKGRNFYQTTSSQSTNPNETGKTLPKTYLVKEGDDLWSISEKIYGSGYNWVDVANENKLVNPGVLYVGTKLTIPNVKPKVVQNVMDSSVNAQSGSPITGPTYTIQKGDYLWSIAVRAYGNGYKWPEIAKANNLTNPDLIFSGNVLKLPR
jgi:nucleoid-associated protein YgaU